jgi:hypothetical protein
MAVTRCAQKVAVSSLRRLLDLSNKHVTQIAARSSASAANEAASATHLPRPWGGEGSESVRQPFNRFSNAGFVIATEVRPSKGTTGWGRFLKEPVKKGWVIRADPIVSASTFLAHGGVKEGSTVAIELGSADDIDNLVEAWTGDQLEITAIREKMSWYMAGVPSERTDREKGLMYILAHTFHTNHRIPPNIETVVKNGMLFHRALSDLPAETELILCEETMNIDPFVSKWCESHGLTDVGTAQLINANTEYPVINDKVE